MEQQGTGHSEQYFGDYRDFWWNKGFLDLMAERLDLKRFQKLLDVGAGKCHWSRLLVPYLKAPAAITAVDAEEKWTQNDPEVNAIFEHEGATLKRVKAKGHQLPFEDNSFDMVTCQTLLIHVPNPQQVLHEMKRVLKPGGILLCVEPNNMVQTLIKNSLTADDPIQEVTDHVKYALICERGKKKLGYGDNSIGDLLPGMFAKEGLQEIEVRLSDKAIAMYPPYDKEEQEATLKQWARSSRWELEGVPEKAYFEAFGDRYLDFYDYFHRKYRNAGKELLHSLEQEQYHTAGGALMYLVSGIK